MLLDKIGDGTSEADARDIEAAYEAVMAVHDACEGEMDVRGARGDWSPRAEGGDPRRPMYADGEVRGDGGATYGEDDQPTTLLAPEQRMVDTLRHPSSDLRGLTIGRYLRAMVTDGGSDLERRALSEGTDSAGGYTVPEVLSANLIDLMRASHRGNQGGARTVALTSNQHHIAKLASDPVPVWRAKAGIVAASDSTFTRVTFEPKSLAVLVKVSRELLEGRRSTEPTRMAVLLSPSKWFRPTRRKLLWILARFGGLLFAAPALVHLGYLPYQLVLIWLFAATNALS